MYHAEDSPRDTLSPQLFVMSFLKSVRGGHVCISVDNKERHCACVGGLRCSECKQDISVS